MWLPAPGSGGAGPQHKQDPRPSAPEGPGAAAPLAMPFPPLSPSPLFPPENKDSRGATPGLLLQVEH